MRQELLKARAVAFAVSTPNVNAHDTGFVVLQNRRALVAAAGVAGLSLTAQLLRAGGRLLFEESGFGSVDRPGSGLGRVQTQNDAFDWQFSKVEESVNQASTRRVLTGLAAHCQEPLLLSSQIQSDSDLHQQTGFWL